MSGFFSSLFAEVWARRRRLRAQFGDRGQALVEFLVLGGLALGSLGLFVRPWMAAAAPWGFALPFVFVLGYGLIDARRQAGVAGDAARFDWAAFLWCFGCALAGAAAFVIAWTAAPPAAPEEEIWTPPPDAVSIDLNP